MDEYELGRKDLAAELSDIIRENEERDEWIVERVIEELEYHINKNL